jgi:putrescine:ornithine antiporter
MAQGKRKMGVIQLTVLTAVNMMGSGIILLPTNLAQVGTISIFSWIVTTLGATLLAYAFARAGTLSNKAGGMGGYAEYAFGRSGNFLTNYTYGISLLIANVAIAVSAVGYAVVLFHLDLSPLSTTLLVIGVLWLATILNFGSPRITGNISSVTVWGVIVPVLGISIIGWFWFHPSLYTTAWNPHGYSFFHGVSASIAITLWAFLGLESACANSDAVENPKKNVPIAVLGGTLGAAILYIVSTNVIAGIVPNLDLARSTAPFGLAFSQMFTPTVGNVIMGLLVISCFGSLLGWQFTIAEVFRSSAEVGYFPSIFQRVSKLGAPIIGMILITVVQTGLSLLTISPSLTTQFVVLVNLAVVTNLVPYPLSMGALPTMQRVLGISERAARTANVVAVLAGVYSLYALYSAGEQAVMWGGIATFAGWILYGQITERSSLDRTTGVPDPRIIAGNGAALTSPVAPAPDLVALP